MGARTVLIGTDRCTGKTTKAIKLAMAFNATLVEPDKAQAMNALKMAGRTAPHLKVVSFEEFVKAKNGDSGPIVIDGADAILGNLLNRSIAAMTVDATMLEGSACATR